MTTPRKRARAERTAPTRRSEVDQPLRDDVHFLGRLLGDVIVEQESAELLALEERVRKLAIARRRREPEHRAEVEAELVALLRDVPLEDAVGVIRAFSTYFRLVNMAEQHHRIRRARAHAIAGDRPQRGSIAAVLLAARAADVPVERVRAVLSDLEVTLTFTAHPSEAARRTVLDKLNRIAERLEERDRCAMTPHEGEDAYADMREQVTALWQTDELRRERPTVGDEAKNVVWHMSEILWDVLPEIAHEIARAFQQAYGEPLGPARLPVRLHTWAGGDMDGNPLVSPRVVEDALWMYRIEGLRRLGSDLDRLGELLSQSSRYVTPPDALLRSIERDAASMPNVAHTHEARTVGEPWRRKLRFVEARLGATLERAEIMRAAAERGEAGMAPDRGIPPYERSAELCADLEIVSDTLRDAGCARAGERRARVLLERVRATGFSIAELEIRVVAREAREAAAWVSRGGEGTDRAVRFIDALRAIARVERASGDSGCRTLVLSMASSVDDVLAALECARACGLWDDARSAARLDIVPLFETFDALRASSAVLGELVAHPLYRRHLDVRGVQEVMLGYSDSGKEVGLLAASAALRRAQTELPRVAAAASVALRIFHGRGETVARGAGPLQQAIWALPDGSVAGRYKATEQGEALDQKYARPALAMRTLELVVGGAILHTLGAAERPTPDEESRFSAMLDELAEVGRDVYRALVTAPTFPAFFAAATPIDEIAKLPIGSRPSARPSGADAGGAAAVTVERLRAIPWVFSWTQNRVIVPGWYGVGSALETVAARRGGEAALRTMDRRWPFFRTLLDAVEMVLAKTDLGIAARYAALAPADARREVWDRIVAEHARTMTWLPRIRGTRAILANNPVLARSIRLRNPYVDPLSFLQVELLRRSRAGDANCERALLLTLNGIAAGMRNTG